MMDQGDRFGFYDVAGEGDQAGDEADDNQPKDKAISPPLFTIDEGILPPTLCNSDGSAHTKCLLSLVTEKSKSHKNFRAMVRLVETFEVSCIKYDLYYISQNFKMRTSQASTTTTAVDGSSYCGHGTVFICLKTSMGTGDCLSSF